MYFVFNDRWAMSQSLPIGDFKMLRYEEFYNIDFENLADDSEFGYMLEVDLFYPPELHDLHNDYPLAPEKIIVSDDMLSPYQIKMKDELGVKSNGKVKKLVPNFYTKRNYVLHYRNYKFYLKQGFNSGYNSQSHAVTTKCLD